MTKNTKLPTLSTLTLSDDEKFLACGVMNTYGDETPHANAKTFDFFTVPHLLACCGIASERNDLTPSGHATLRQMCKRIREQYPRS